jgi:hypothetical protein
VAAFEISQLRSARSQSGSRVFGAKSIQTKPARPNQPVFMVKEQ